MNYPRTNPKTTSRKFKGDKMSEKVLTKYEHGNTKYGADQVEQFAKLRKEGLTVKQIIDHMSLDTNAKALSKFFARNGITK